MQKLVWQNANGIELDLTSGNYGITEWEGFSNTGLNIQTQTVPFQDGGVFLDALMEQRELSVTLAIQDNNNLTLRYQQRRELISALNPKLGEGYLIYTNDFISKRIKCVPQIPIFETHNSDTAGTPKASLSWTACEPYWEDLEESSITLERGEFANIENDGDIDIQFRAEINGITQQPILQNKTTKKHIKLTGSYNDQIYINTEMGNKAVEKRSLQSNVLQGGSIYGLTTDGEKIIYVGSQLLAEDKYGVKESFSVAGLGSTYYRDICYANGVYVIVGGGSYYLYTGTDLQHLAQRFVQSITSQTFYKIVYGEDKFVAVGGQYIIYSSDGVNWNRATISSQLSGLQYVVYSETLHIFIATANSSSNKYLKSTDGINWDLFTVNDMPNGAIRQVCFDGQKFVFISSDKIPYYSLNGETWVSGEAQSGDFGTNKICYGNGVYLCFYTSNKIGYSQDGLNWSEIQLEPSMQDIKYIDNTFYMVFSDGKVLTSVNGKDWFANIPNICPQCNSRFLIFYKNMFITMGHNSVIGADCAYISKDGYKWESITQTSSNSSLYSATEGNGIIIAVGYNGRICSSVDGKNWEVRTSGVSTTLNGIAYANNIFVAVGEAGTIITSEDNGITWVARGNFTANINSICYNPANNVFVAVGNSSKVYKSVDGIEWEEGVVSSSSYTLNSIAFGNNICIAISTGAVFYTKDMVNWTREFISANMNINKIYFNDYDKCFLATGRNTLLKTYDGENLDITNIGLSASSLYIAYGNGKYLLLSLSDHTLVELINKQITNIINNIDNTSDMGMSLKTNENTMYFNTGGSASISIYYRQKYIGV